MCREEAWCIEQRAWGSEEGVNIKNQISKCKVTM